MIEPGEFLQLFQASVVEALADQIKAAVSGASFRIESAILLANRRTPLAVQSANQDFSVANPDLSSGSIVPVFPQDIRRLALGIFPRGTGPVSVFLNFEATPRTLIEVRPGHPHKLIFDDFGPAMQQSVSAQSPGGQSGITLWSVIQVR